jgi:hypothetical protein
VAAFLGTGDRIADQVGQAVADQCGMDGRHGVVAKNAFNAV